MILRRRTKIWKKVQLPNCRNRQFTKKGVKWPTMCERMFALTEQRNVSWNNNKMPLAEIKINSTTQCPPRSVKTGTLVSCGWECKLVPSFWSAIWQDLKWNVNFLTLLREICSQKFTDGKKLWMKVFTAVLFIIRKLDKPTLEKAKCPIRGEWLNYMGVEASALDCMLVFCAIPMLKL